MIEENERLIKCEKCGSIIVEVEIEGGLIGYLARDSSEVYQMAKRIESILQSPQDAYQKKVALFNLVKNLEIEGDIAPGENKRINCLLEGKLYNELAKQKMGEYKKLTVEDFSKN